MPLMPCRMPVRLRAPVLVIVAIFVLAGCAIQIQQPANNAAIYLPSTTKVVVTGNAPYTGLKVGVDGVDVSAQIVAGPTSDEAELSLPAGLHTITASADVSCFYCPGSKTHSVDTKSFAVFNGGICARTGGDNVITIPASAIAIAKQPGPHSFGYWVHRDGIMIIVNEAPELRPTQMRVELDIDPFNGVTWNKAIEAWGFCRSGSRVGLVEATMVAVGLNVGLACPMLQTGNDFRSGCTNTQTMLLDQSTTSELWLRKPGTFGVWFDSHYIDSSIWQAFGGHSVRFIWRFD